MDGQILDKLPGEKRKEETKENRADRKSLQPLIQSKNSSVELC